MRAILDGGAYIKKNNCHCFELVEPLYWEVRGTSWDGHRFASGVVPLEFACDGCTAWPDGFLWLKYRRQCFVHDYLCRYHVKTEADRFIADNVLRCLIPGIGIMRNTMYVGVRAYSMWLHAQGKVR